MPKICYVEKRFGHASLELVEQANTIISSYSEQGYSLTLRQLYYQFVARDLLPNTQKSYSRLGSIISDARLAGLVDWRAIEDRTRETVIRARWSSPQEILQAAADSYHEDLWERQPLRVEVWVEKEALAGIFDRVCRELDVPFLACRGYASQSEMWRAASRMRKYMESSTQSTVVLHFGDHDPSGLDMTRDIRDRLETFLAPASVRRVALNMDQIEEYSPPPNPAKATDSRFVGYEEQYGDESLGA